VTDQLEQGLREVLSQQATQILDPDTLDRLRAIDYRPRNHRVRRLPAVGAVGVTGAAATAGVLITLGSSAAPAFAGWQATPTTPAPSAIALNAQTCGQGLGSPVLTDSRGPYTAAIYAQGTTNDVCLAGNGLSISSSASADASDAAAAGQVQLNTHGLHDASGDGATLVDGQVGAGVTAVTVELSNGASVQATVSGGWYLAWWPDIAAATSVQVTSASGTNTQTFPAAPAIGKCPDGGNCAYSYHPGSSSGQDSGSVSGGGPQTSTTSVH
jgi:hypothetical protein